MSVVEVRHPNTAANSEDIVRGWENHPLDAKGREQAVKVAAELAKKYRVARIISSDLDRAMDQANALSKATGVPVKPSKLLRTWGRGPEIEGKPTKKVQPLIEYFVAHPRDRPKGGESFGEFLSRIIGAVRAALADEPRYGDTILVTHLTPILATKDWVKAGRPHDPLKASYKDPDLKGVKVGDDWEVPEQ